MPKYALGVDFGTLSARSLVAEIGTGRELAWSAMDYPHGVMDERLPDGTRLPPDWALQHPQDYLDCLGSVIPDAIRKAGVRAEDIVGVGIDCTACTLIPVDEAGVPLCFHDAYRAQPHAYAKLWKHHATQREADRITEVAEARGEAFLARYGGKVSSEWMLPKIWQLLNESPALYDRTDRFMDAGDWIVMQLTGARTRSQSIVGYKAFWHKADGYPSSAFFEALDPRLAHLVDEKLGRETHPIGGKAGEVTAEAAALTGLRAGTAVAVCCIDAHVSLPPAGVTQPGDMLMIMGTSTCHIMLGEREQIVPGMCGVVEDGVMPGLMGYEAGQSCVGDGFNWFVDNCVPQAYHREAAQRGLDLHQLLTEKASLLRPGQSGLLALDWLNGNRSVLVDFDLTGLLLGMTLQTRPEEIYRALIEATAYGTRTIIETFELSGVRIENLFACGGISHKNPLVMQIYADVLKREIRIARSTQTSALGSALFGAVAAGAARGGYATIRDAAREMGGVLDTVYRPDTGSAAVYEQLYGEYRTLHDYFGRGGNGVMKRLKRIKERQNG